ncbi:MAG: 6-phosphofructokinase [Chloroflexi bacterium]|nr:6-phosphofructokinase [Chloroflexota bacterium]
MSKVHAVAIITSGGDAPGMNAAIRAAVRMALHGGLEVYGIHNGWQGAVDGGEAIEKMTWGSVGGILQRGGTVLGTARCRDFRRREGRRQAAANLYRLGIDGLVVIGGDGSLTGAHLLAAEWPQLLQEALAPGQATLDADAPPQLAVVGLPGSIDNDTYGSDMSIGADTALHRIVTAADQLASTASAHQRTFIMEVMGRHCGYLALAGGLAAGSHWLIVPEEELNPRWHREMVASLQRGRDAGRQHAIIMLSEGARHPDGLPLKADTVRDILMKRLGIEARVTVLGHVQRGGAPSAFDRVLASRLGAAAIENLMTVGADAPPRMLGIVENKVQSTPLDEMVTQSRSVGECIDEGDYDAALQLRGHSFQEQLKLFKLLTQSAPDVDASRGNLLVLTAGHDAPGMNSCVQVLTRVALNRGYRVLGGQYGFSGLLEEDIRALGWMDVSGWAGRGGSELGAGRYLLQEADLPMLAQVLRQHQVSALVIVGGLDAYRNLALIQAHRQAHPEFQLPAVIIPASITNSLPLTDFSLGTDTALNNIVSAIDRVKDTAGANKRAFVVEVAGYHSGYLAVMAALASGAEGIYLPEEGITLQQLAADVSTLRHGFELGKRLSIWIQSENASPVYDQSMVRRILDEEGGALFDVRSVVLGHTQRGGAPSPFDRILAGRFAVAAIECLAKIEAGQRPDYRCIGLRGKHILHKTLDEALSEMDWPYERPRQQWFMKLVPLARTL